ncbi:diacylglycerol/lipid kinase family protein [Larkinella soli]|uniref:diacylglycerol/lipid kinase family protein n=1 Tax=Larkinella soli TaxID=1770527 RepID=UPI000FFB994F|nr:diacylglycerol kinase family protein [Larkinella soli]
MTQEKKLRFLFAINPVSGGKDKSDWDAGIREYFREAPHTMEILNLNGETDEQTLPDRIAAYRPDRLVAVGGDGTIKFVGEFALERNLPLGILPAGSANGLASELGLPMTVRESIEIAVNGIETPIDLIRINDHDLCLHMSDIGMNAQLVKYFQDNNLRGKLGYARGAFRVLMRSKLMQIEIDTGEETVQRAAFMVVLANARQYGTGAVINPEGDVSDGRFEVVVLRKLSFFEILKMFYRFRPFDPSHIEIFQATEVRLTTRRKAYFQVDGEYRGKVRQIRAEILPGRLRVMLAKPA